MATSMIAVSALFFIGHALNWFFIKSKIPDLLILIIIGYLLGPVFGFLQAEDFGKAGSLISTLALVVILYEGGLNLTARDLAASFSRSLSLSILGFLSIVGIGTLIVFVFTDIPLKMALLLGVGIGSTSSAVVIPLVKPLSISEKTKTLLSLESAITDVLAIVIFLVLVDGFSSGLVSPTALIMGIGPNTLIAIALGLGSGLVWATVKKRFGPVFQMAFAGEAWALLTYGVLETMGFNGAIGALALGFALANLHLLPQWLKTKVSAVPVSYRDFSLLKELTFLLKTFFFIYLGVLINFSNLNSVLVALAIAVFIFITRYLVLLICLNKNQTSKLDAKIVNAMGPRGLACAVLATIPIQRGLANGAEIQNIIFAVIPFSILFTAIFVAVFENNKTPKFLDKLWGKFKVEEKGS